MKKYCLLLLPFLITCSSLFSQNLDTYNFIKTTINGYNVWAYDFAYDTAGNIYAAGNIEDPNTDFEETAVLKYLPNGVLDNTFGIDGVFIYNFGSEKQTARDIEIDSNGKVVITGIAIHSNTERDIFIARLTQNGTLDTSFNSNGIVSIANGYANDVHKVLISNEGKIIVGGTIATSTNTSLALIRLNDNGSYDNTFSLNGISTIDVSTIFPGATSTYVGNSIHDLHILSDGKILAFTSVNHNTMLVKYNTSGSLDTTYGAGDGMFIYNPPSGIIHYPQKFHVNNDGSVFMFIRGFCYSCNAGSGNVLYYWVFKIDANGAYDITFSDDGQYFISNISFPQTAIAVSETQEVYVGVEIYSNFEVRKLTSTGSLDTSFHGDGSWNPTEVERRKMFPYEMSVNSNNELMILGKFFISGFLDNFFFYSPLPTQNNVILSVEEAVLNGEFALYPNPTKDVFYVKNDNFSRPVTIEVYNSLGMRLFTKEISTIDNTVSLKGYASGVYYIKFSGTNTTSTILKN
ncbi:delta-60 repeat domain-containing protein [Kordia jejudonensis]|uniref:delta-60 repeat domain-containing protein n=1 Tax=Kordia jejudonensis TaxID=1348245 RepID=UPI000629C997|nr:delta-60 repeat domain-containing protein [Kordia jejudonensis]